MCPSVNEVTLSIQENTRFFFFQNTIVLDYLSLYNLAITITIILIRGANPNAVNVQSTTPLHYLVRGQYSEELIEVDKINHSILFEVLVVLVCCYYPYNNDAMYISYLLRYWI